MTDEYYQKYGSAMVRISQLEEEIAQQEDYVGDLEDGTTRLRGLLRRCKDEMEISVKDFEESINPWLEAANYHPVTQTPRAMRKLVDELAEELDKESVPQEGSKQ